MIFSNYKFRFSLLGTVLGLIGLIIFSSLGTWQVYRALEKQALQQKMDEQIQSEVIKLDKNIDNLERRTYSQVAAVGHYDSKNEILIDNAIHNRLAGYHVLTPFVLKHDQSVIMVNRGWVPVNRDRRILPVLDSPSGELSIKGTLSPVKSKPPLILGELDTSSKVWLYFDAEIFSKKTGKQLLPLTILLDKNEPGGYVREWPKYEEKVAMHVGYAIQWYVFALIVLATYLGMNIKKNK